MIIVIYLHTAPGVCALGWVKYREQISLLVMLCIIVYVTNKKIFFFFFLYIWLKKFGNALGIMGFWTIST